MRPEPSPHPRKEKEERENGKRLKVLDCISFYNYLANHGEKMNYGSARRGGYHTGSGAIESANKFISHTRLKRSGAWWYIKYANNMLKIRCAKYNGTYDKIVERYKKEDQERIKNKYFKQNLRVVK